MSKSEHGQFGLMKTSRFLPLFITQFFGAFNDNVFKNALIILLAFNASILPSGMSESLAVNISAGLFILPFFLFSSLAGQIADYNEKAKLVKILKTVELFLIILCGASLYLQNIHLMWLALFLMGTQSTFFGPIKYSILPQHLKESELVGGNALIEMGTFISILLGTIAGGVLISLPNGVTYIFALLLISAVIGLVSACKIPQALPAGTGKVSFNLVKQSWEIIKIAREVKSVFLSILGISWFWFLGATFLSQFPVLVKDVLQSHENTVTILLIVFSVGIALGSVACEKLSRGKIEPGLVPYGALGMTLFGLTLYFALNSYSKQRLGLGIEVLSIKEFMTFNPSIFVMASLFGLAVFGGFYTVPLYAMIQARSKPTNRSRTIAANNIINSLFMIGSAVFAIICFTLGLTVTELILATIVLNAIVSIYIFTVIPEFMMRFYVWILINLTYKIKESGLENIPEDGPAIIVSNHVSFVDALIIFGTVRRPVKFVMYYKIYNHPLMKPLFKSVGAIPIASKIEDEKIFNEAFERMAQYLKDGELVMIFPEGKITDSEEFGKINEFKPGILKVLEKINVPVIPSALSGLWGSRFSKITKEQKKKLKNDKSHRKGDIHYRVGKPILGENLNLKSLEDEVIKLRDFKD